jgi:hypothetical protein
MVLNTSPLQATSGVGTRHLPCQSVSTGPSRVKEEDGSLGTARDLCSTFFRDTARLGPSCSQYRPILTRFPLSVVDRPILTRFPLRSPASMTQHRSAALLQPTARTDPPPTKPACYPSYLLNTHPSRSILIPPRLWIPPAITRHLQNPPRMQYLGRESHHLLQKYPLRQVPNASTHAVKLTITLTPSNPLVTPGQLQIPPPESHLRQAF